MRILLIAALLVSTASCAWPPPPRAAAAPPPIGQPMALVPPPAAMPPPPGAQPVALAPAPAPAAQASLWLPPLPFVHLFATPPGRLTLNNFTFDSAHIQAVVTTAPLCGPGAGGAASDFDLPLNGTRVIQVPPGADVCWRRENPPAAGQAALPAPPWTGWNRAFTSSGRTIDARL